MARRRYPPLVSRGIIVSTGEVITQEDLKTMSYEKRYKWGYEMSVTAAKAIGGVPKETLKDDNPAI